MIQICRVLALALSVQLLIGCATATHNTLANGAPASPKIMSGTRLNVAVIQNDEETLQEFAKYGIFPPRPKLPFFTSPERVAAGDLVCSALADALLLPATVPYAAYHRLINPPD
ncbi:hypothetical protein [uncultured Abyssibacter sp.]|uniref:hypothetical protein n=1 Tax=uncultured Abyssibacter sp. TaxID=2320202 RepID=UPI0032B10BA2